MKKVVILLILFLCTVSANPLLALEQTAERQFRTIGLQQGLSNSQVNTILKDSRGYIWFGTVSGLNRFDGVRFKKFFSRAGNEQTLTSNWVTHLFEDFDGNIWVETLAGYCVFHPVTESFDQHPEVWMQTKGMEGRPQKVYVDAKKNLWVAINGKGVYLLSPKQKQARLFPHVRNGRSITGISGTKEGVAIIDDDGMITEFGMSDATNKQSTKRYDDLLKQGLPSSRSYTLYVDRHNRFWVSTEAHSMVYDPSSPAASGKWFSSITDWLSAHGIHYDGGHVQMIDMTEDAQGNLWMATDHSGLLMIGKDNQFKSYTAEKEKKGTLPDNTLQCLMFDENNALWVGTLKNGAAYSWAGATRFPLMPLGDVCTLAEDHLGNIWCGTNDQGIICYQPMTGVQRVYHRKETGLGSDVVVSSLCASDGSLWFGTFNGGLAHVEGGHFKVYREKDGLGSDNIWALAEGKDGHIIIGTLGGGVQELDAKTGVFRTYNTQNSGLASNYISSLFTDRQGNVLIGHSQNFSIMDGATRKIVNYEKTREGQPFVSQGVIQILLDSRGLIWDATSSGVNVYDPATDQLIELSGMGCSVAEDQNHDMWIVSDMGLSKVRVSKENGQWQLSVSNYDSLDGLQSRQFNYRSILVRRNGDILLGGQDGVNIVPHVQHHEHQAPSHALFSGLILFDHPLAVGEEYNGKVVLKEAINESKRLVLEYNENAFTIQLTSSTFVYPSRRQYLYRLVGFNDQWLRTSVDRSEVTYTNLSPGTYHLQVYVLDRYGKPYPEMSELEIVIRPPFYLSVWAFILYFLAIAALLYYIYHRVVTRQKEKFEMEQMRREAEHEREMDNMKMRFYTNASHELRTPLTLMISPLSYLIRKEEDTEKRSQLTMIHRNAERLLSLVNDLLDFRKLEADKVKLNRSTGDLVGHLQSICYSFQQMKDKHIQLSFESSEQTLLMSYDDDKIMKVMNNLLSNAYKFTEKGNIDVSLSLVNNRSEVQIQVSDTGVGISDDDKQHIFERFYQVEIPGHQTAGGTGIGLSMVKDFVEMHGGSIAVADRPGGGTAFTILLPYIRGMAESLSSTTPSQEMTIGTQTIPEGSDKKPELLLVDDSEDFLTFMTTVLKDQYQIRVAHDGKEALTMVAEQQPDLILSDVMMPVMDGIELCRAIKQNPHTAKIPFVMLTARMAQEHQMEGLESGADDYVTKPFDIDMLALRMNNLLKWRDAKKGLLEPQLKEIEITSLDEQLVKEATEYVEQNISDSDLSVESLSTALSMSRVHLYKKLLSLTGNTPSEFIRLIRLRRAEQLLRQSQLSVAEISYAVGFNNPRYFSKYFREMYGMTPSQFKETNKT